MPNRIIIGKPHIKLECETVKLCAEIREENNTLEMFFEFDKEYESYLCLEYSDPFVLMVLEYAMAKKLDLICEYQMSDTLFYNLRDYFIPIVSGNTKTFHRINLMAPISVEDRKYCNGKVVGTGFSCGVDSLNVVFKYLNYDIPRYKLSHLFFFNNGAMGPIIYEETKYIFDQEKIIMQEAADELGLDLICVNTNMMALYGEIPRHRANNNEGLKIGAVIYAIRGKVKTYYIASSVGLEMFKFSDHDVGFFVPFTAYIMSSDSCRFYIGDLDTPKRIDKVNKISDSTVAQKYLRGNTINNNKKSPKSIRTQMELMVLGKLGFFSATFDVEDFEKNYAKLFGRNIASKKEWEFGYNQEIIKKAKERGVHISLQAYLWGCVWFMGRFTKVLLRRFFRRN